MVIRISGHSVALGVACLLGGAALVGIARGGPLDPPAGPVSPTLKTLTEVEPRIAVNAVNTPQGPLSAFRISQPGSYYLTGNLTATLNHGGIEITSSGVTLDLNGFDVVGVPGTFDGIFATVANGVNITILNGSVRGWGGDGIDLALTAVEDARISGVTSSGNAGIGIRTGTSCLIDRCVVASNGAGGINSSTGCTIIGCIASENTLDGINVSDGCTVTACTSQLNTGSGINASIGCTISNSTARANQQFGIAASNGCLITGCTARSNTQDGIIVVNACTITGCHTHGNGFGGGDGTGIHASGSDNRLDGNTCLAADRGIDVDLTGNIITRNVCSGNGTNWTVATGNVILVVSGVTNGVAINGSAGGTAPGSTDPNANFSY